MIKPAVNTIVHAAHAAAADDGLREASVVNIEMRGGRGQVADVSTLKWGERGQVADVSRRTNTLHMAKIKIRGAS